MSWQGRRVAALLAVFMLCSSALAHTAVKSVTPAAHASVAAPKNVEIAFNEAVDLHFATFKVYPLAVQGDRLALNRAAAHLTKTALKAKNDESVRVNEELLMNGKALKVTLPLRATLPSGPYVFMWRVLSADGHVITGHSVFHVK